MHLADYSLDGRALLTSRIGDSLACIASAHVNPYSPELSQLRRRLRGLPHSTLLSTLQQQIEGLSTAALAADNTGRYVAANHKACELTGYSRAELLRMNVRDLTPAIRQETAGELWNRFIQLGSQAGEYMLQRKDGVPTGVRYDAFASVAPGVHISMLTVLEVPSSI